MDSLRKTSLLAGLVYLLLFVAIPTLFLYGPVQSLNHITGSGPDTGALLGGLIELMGGAAPVIDYTAAALLAAGYGFLSWAILSTVLMRREVTS